MRHSRENLSGICVRFEDVLDLGVAKLLSIADPVSSPQKL